MPTINDRIGSQNAIRVLSNASAPPTRIVNLTDINAARKGESGLTLVWNHNAEEFFLTDSFNAPGGYTYSVGIVTFANQIESTSASTGGVLFQGGVGITSNLYIGGSSGITSNFSVIGITTLASNGGITTTGGDLYIGGQLYSGDSTIGSDGISVSGIVTANAVSIGATQVLSDAFQLQNIASLDTTTTATIEAAVSAAPNTFTNLDITGISTFQETSGFVGLATFGGGIDVVAGVSTFANDVKFDNGLHVRSGVTTFAANIIVEDNGQVQIGNSADLVITHDTSNTIVDQQGAGNLIVKYGGFPKVTISPVGSATTIADDINVLGVGTFHAIGVTTITAVSATFTGPVTIGGTLTYEDVTNIDSVGLITARSGVRVTGGGLNVVGVTTFDNSDVVFQGAAGGQNITFDASENDLEFTDAARIKFGNSDDLEIWHDAPNSHIKNSTGDFKIRSDSLALKTADDSEKYLKAVKNEDVKLYYNNNEKFATISTGATVTGDLYISGDLHLSDDLVLDNITGNSLKITGISTFASTLKVEGLTSGRVVYAGTGGELQDSANLTFDGTELSAGLIDGGSY